MAAFRFCLIMPNSPAEKISRILLNASTSNMSVFPYKYDDNVHKRI